MARWLTRGEVLVFHHSSFSPQSFAPKSWKRDAAPIVFASLGGVRAEHRQAKRKQDDDYEISSPLPDFVVSRIRDGLVDGVLHDDVINRAKQRKLRVEEEALLLLI